jgi:hypothetical protein
MIGGQLNFLLVGSILLLFFRKYVLKGFQNKLSKQASISFLQTIQRWKDQGGTHNNSQKLLSKWIPKVFQNMKAFKWYDLILSLRLLTLFL